MSAVISTAVGGLMGRLARRYVAWTERPLKASLLELALPELESRDLSVAPHPGLDLPSLAECGDEWLVRRVYNRIAAGDPGYRRARVIDILAFAASPEHDPRAIFLARSGRDYVGLCVGRLGSGGVGRLYSLAVAPGARGRGVGRLLVRRTLAWLRDHGAREARLYVLPDNLPALALYRSEGFVPVMEAERSPDRGAPAAPAAPDALQPRAIP